MTRSPWQRAQPALVLASGSATRARLLEACGLRFDIVPPDLDEAPYKQAARLAGESASEAAVALAVAKALAVSTAHPEALVIGADQILSVGEMWFDKPRDLGEARRHLELLSGRRAILHTAAVLARGRTIVWQHIVEPVILHRSASASFLDLYVAREGSALLQSVGACRIEGFGQHLIERIDGEHAAILGLPLLDLLAALRDEGAILA